MGDKVYVCNVTLRPGMPGGNDTPWISTYAIYHGPNLEELLYPSDLKIKELTKGKEIVGHHPKGEYHAEARQEPIQIDKAYSLWTLYAFHLLDQEQIEKVLQLRNAQESV